MNMFEDIQNIINYKNNVIVKDGDNFVPYLMQRWISMISPEMAYVLNETINEVHWTMKSPQMWYDAFLTLVPKVGYQKISYIKKDKTPPEPDVKLYAQRMEISIKEAKDLMELDKTILNKEKSVEVHRKRS